MNQNMQQVPVMKPPKLEDEKRIQKILDELNAKYIDRKGGSSQQIVMDEKSKLMFIDYANELTISVLEAASLLAQHRGSKTIDFEDVGLVLAKKLGIELAGYSTMKHQSANPDPSGQDTPSGPPNGPNV
mmetsp:Transcript_77252/g.151543  ORF Transcript_77252/g.151543 Transcript_77252/m.151543 type:complete len:129 (+) Transcript_77252:20-406(+)